MQVMKKKREKEKRRGEEGCGSRYIYSVRVREGGDGGCG